MKEDQVEVFRLVRYRGSRTRVEDAVKKSIHGEQICGVDLTISAVTLQDFPTLLQEEEDSKDE